MDTRRLILVVIFFFSSAMLWENWQKFNQPKIDPAVPPAATVQNGGAPQPSPGLVLSQANSPSAPATAAGETFTVTTDLLKAQFTTQGGDLNGLELLKFRAHEGQDKNFQLIDAGHQYATQTGLIGEGLPNHRTVFKRISGPDSLAEGSNELKVSFVAVNEQGIKVTKTYTFKRGSYLVGVNWDVANGSAQNLAPHAYYQLQRDDVAPAGESRMVSTFTGPAVFSEDGKYQKVDFSDIAKEKAKFVKTSDNGWLAMVQHYFVTAWVPHEKTTREYYMRKADASSNIFQVGLITPLAPIAAGASGQASMQLFAGPQEQSLLKQVAPGLELVVDYGWLTVIAAPIFWVLEAIHKVVGNWGWAIILLTVGLKAIFYPLSATSYKSMAKMRLLTPRLMHLKERYADDRQRLNQEMMKLYQTEKVNPLGGCLPILIQIPVFIALYWVLLGAVEMRGAPWLGWIHDLASADPYYILPVIMVATMIIQTKLNPTPPDPVQAKVTMMMPFIFGAMFFFFPAGLVLYWVVNNVLSIAQQWRITQVIEAGGRAANDAKA